jgi:hypothetical protein
VSDKRLYLVDNLKGVTMRKSIFKILTTATLLSVPLVGVSQTAPPNSLPGYGAVSNWGCEVMLCLADPKGPMDKAECKPPITKLYKAIFRWKPQPFPVCILSNGSNSQSTGNYAKVGPSSYYDSCPAGLTPLAAGEVALLGPNPPTGPMPVSNPTPNQTVGVGIGDGAGLHPGMNGENEFTMPNKVCVGSVTGSTSYTSGAGDNGSTMTVNTYSSFAVIPPAPNTFTVELYINNQLYKSVRPGVIPAN